MLQMMGMKYSLKRDFITGKHVLFYKILLLPMFWLYMIISERTHIQGGHSLPHFRVLCDEVLDIEQLVRNCNVGDQRR